MNKIFVIFTLTSYTCTMMYLVYTMTPTVTITQMLLTEYFVDKKTEFHKRK